jgi:hypothetical protein
MRIESDDDFVGHRSVSVRDDTRKNAKRHDAILPSLCSQNFWQLSIIHCNAPRLIEGEHLGDVRLLAGLA